jgi:hypothetical protein
MTMAKKNDAELMTVTCRLPVADVDALDREAERMARETGTTFKRSDMLRIAVHRLLETAQAAK